MLKYIISCWLGLLLCSCSSADKSLPEVFDGEDLVFEDELGREVRLRQWPLRILPLCASSQEILVLLCDSSMIVGRTPECNTPEWISSKPLVINYPLDIEKVVSLKPDLIVSKEGMLSNDQLLKLESIGLPVYMQRANTIKGIAESIRKLAQVLGQEQKGKEVAIHFITQFDSLKTNADTDLSSAVVFISSDPIYVFGYSSYITDLLLYCGLENAVDSSIQQEFPVVDQEFLLKLDPDFLVFSENQKRTQELFVKYPLLKNLRAYREKRCLYINGDWLSRPSPELVKAAAEIIKQKNSIKVTMHP